MGHNPRNYVGQFSHRQDRQRAQQVARRKSDHQLAFSAYSVGFVFGVIATGLAWWINS